MSNLHSRRKGQSDEFGNGLTCLLVCGAHWHEWSNDISSLPALCFLSIGMFFYQLLPGCLSYIWFDGWDTLILSTAVRNLDIALAKTSFPAQKLNAMQGPHVWLHSSPAKGAKVARGQQWLLGTSLPCLYVSEWVAVFSVRYCAIGEVRGRALHSYQMIRKQGTS